MKISILTLFPEMFDTLSHSILGRAQQKNLIEINTYDIRKFSEDKHGKCDDYPFGGGAGMVMTPQPIFDAIASVDPNREYHRIYLSPKGSVLCSQKVIEISKNYDKILLLCGHYEGIDQRVIDYCIDEEISIGDYILTGGELPAMVLVDTIARYVPDVLGSSEATTEESFSSNLLEYPQYTRPQNFRNMLVPDILISGHHENIDKWRNEKAVEITKEKRPDLLDL